ncbi:MAG TPA: MFS transporter [Longimicrobium sp.]|jgi:MFS family permease|uniref:MFS transporter n=1 Tax=Longimicrobium sp. TaxID=2029185 RepID=UPI002ED7E716
MKLPQFLSPGMRTYTAVWFGQMVSMIGTALTDFGVGVWIYQKTGSATPFAMVLLCMVVPGILATPVAGALADRWDRRRTMVLADAGAALSTLFMAVMLFAGRLELWHILAAVAFASTCRAFQGPAWMASTTQLVPAEQLGRASGMMNFGRAVAGILGPALGGVLVPAIGLQQVMLIDFATFIVAVGILFAVRFPPLPARAEPDAPKQPLLKEAAAGWQYVGSQPALRAHLLFFALVNLALGYVWVLHAPLVLGFAGPGSLGLVGSAMGAGLLAGSLVMTITGGPKRKAAAILSYGVLLGLSLMLMGARPWVPLVAAAMFGITVGIPVVNGSLMALWMPRIPADLRGRTYAVIQMLVWSTEPIAYLSAGVLADALFKPLLVQGGPLAGTLGALTGVGPTRGIGLLLGVAGIFVLAVTAAMALLPHFRTADSIPLAAEPDAPPVAAAEEPASEGAPVPVPA